VYITFFYPLKIYIFCKTKNIMYKTTPGASNICYQTICNTGKHAIISNHKQGSVFPVIENTCVGLIVMDSMVGKETISGLQNNIKNLLFYNCSIPPETMDNIMKFIKTNQVIQFGIVCCKLESETVDQMLSLLTTENLPTLEAVDLSHNNFSPAQRTTFIKNATDSNWKYAFLYEATTTEEEARKVDETQSSRVTLIATGTGNIGNPEKRNHYKMEAMMHISRILKKNLSSISNQIELQKKTEESEIMQYAMDNIVTVSEKEWLDVMETQQYIEIHIKATGGISSEKIVAIFGKELSLFANAFVYLLNRKMGKTHSVECHLKKLKHTMPEDHNTSFETHSLIDDLLQVHFASANQVRINI